VQTCVCIRTHTHTAHGVLDVSPGVGTRRLEGPKNYGPDGLNLGIYVLVDVYKVHMCIYMLVGGMRSEPSAFLFKRNFLPKKLSKNFERSTENSNLSYIDPQSRLLNYLF